MVRDDFVKAVATAGEGQSHWLHRQSYVSTAIERFKTHAGALDGASVLDVGCGQGHDVAEFIGRGIECEGLEINPRYVKEGRKLFPSARITKGSAENLPYADGTFALVYCRNLVFCTDPKKSLPELRRVLRPGGVGHVSLDEKIVQLSDNAVLHSAGIDELVALLSGCEILEKEYRERVDEDPTPHRHHYYDVYFRKLDGNSKHG
jgi:ubiquinone/menaquinone biosynthesis C-methylase UbiE